MRHKPRLPFRFSLFERQPRHSQSTFRLRKSFISSRLRPPAPRDRLLEARFSLFLRENIKVTRSPYPQKFTLSAYATLRAEQSSRSRCAHRKVRFSVAGIKLNLGAASRCRSPYPQKFTLSALIRSRCLLIRKMCTAHFRGDGVENAIFNALIKFFLMRRRQPQRTTSAKLYRRAFHVPSRRFAV